MRHYQKEPACVVIPFYRTRLAASEAASLQRCVEVLGQHPMVLVTPRHLDVSEVCARYPRLQTASFADDFFIDIGAYNRLMLSDEFYARFDRYEFILLHQLDAFVFSDQLLHWCVRGYDYIGAPWLPAGPAPDLKRRIAMALRRKRYRWFDIQRAYSGHTHDPQLSYSVGNGGHSLRRVARLRAVLAALPQRAEPYRRRTRRVWAEDIFFAVEANRYRRRIRTPSVKEAVKFAWETRPALAAQLNAGELPFGCHAWDKLHRDEWRTIFASLGYSLDELLRPA